MKPTPITGSTTTSQTRSREKQDGSHVGAVGLVPVRDYWMIGPEQSWTIVGSKLIDQLKMKPLSAAHLSWTKIVQSPLSGAPIKVLKLPDGMYSPVPATAVFGGSSLCGIPFISVMVRIGVVPTLM